VTRIPVTTAAGSAVVTSSAADAAANTAPMTDAPVISPRFRDRFNSPETTPRRSAETLPITDVLLAVWKSA
jgi:hypothetical protein